MVMEKNMKSCDSWRLGLIRAGGVLGVFGLWGSPCRLGERIHSRVIHCGFILGEMVSSTLEVKLKILRNHMNLKAL